VHFRTQHRASAEKSGLRHVKREDLTRYGEDPDFLIRINRRVL